MLMIIMIKSSLYAWYTGTSIRANIKIINILSNTSTADTPIIPITFKMRKGEKVVE